MINRLTFKLKEYRERVPRIVHIVVILIFGTISCITPVEIDTRQSEQYLVVDGRLTQKFADHTIKLSLTSNYGDTKRIPVESAQIELFDTGGQHAVYTEGSPGIYVLPAGNFAVSTGSQCYIEITLANGKVYRSDIQQMPDPIKVTAIRHRIEMQEYIDEDGDKVSKEFIDIYIDTPVRNGNNDGYLMWQGYEAYSFTELKCHPLAFPKTCYIKRKIPDDDFKLFSSEDLDGGELDNFKVASVFLAPPWEFYEKHFYNILQFSETKEAFDYWSNASKVANPSGSIFDVPPASIRGNIVNVNDSEEKVLGIFELTAVDTIRTHTSVGDFENLAIYDRCNELIYSSYSDPPCCDCLVLKDSDEERPYYWDEH